MYSSARSELVPAIEIALIDTTVGRLGLHAEHGKGGRIDDVFDFPGGMIDQIRAHDGALDPVARDRREALDLRQLDAVGLGARDDRLGERMLAGLLERGGEQRRACLCLNVLGIGVGRRDSAVWHVSADTVAVCPDGFRRDPGTLG